MCLQLCNDFLTIGLLMEVFIVQVTEAATRGILQKQVFLKISHIPQKTTCIGVPF